MDRANKVIGLIVNNELNYKDISLGEKHVIIK